VGKRETFALTLLSRQTGVEEGVLLEQMITEWSNDRLTAAALGKHWLELFDPEEGVARLRCFALPRYRPSRDEERIKAFVDAHATFFYDDKGLPYRERVAVLWPNRATIKAYANAWFQTRTEDVHGVAKEMAAALKKAGASVPAGRGKW
jgi:hypothetical protein